MQVRREWAKMEAAESGVSGADPAILTASLSSALPAATSPLTTSASLPRSASDDGAAFVDAPEELPLPNPNPISA